MCVLTSIIPLSCCLAMVYADQASLVYDMSTTTTPSRARPALVIPGTDSRAHFDGKTSMMLMGGLPTPPHSALESRRPSLQFGSLAECAPSAGSTMGAFSQPATPVCCMSSHGDSYSQSWADHPATTTNTPSRLASSFSSSHLSQALAQSAFQTQQSYPHGDIDNIGTYAPANISHQTHSFGPTADSSEQSMWSSPQHVQQSVAHEAPSGLGPPLFAMSHSLAPETNTSDPFGIQDTQYGASSFTTPGGSFHSYATVPSNVYTQQPQVVVPSQLSPQDDYHQQYHALTTSPHHGADTYSTSFGSSISSEWEFIRPPSPSSNYFAQSDEEEYVQVRFERNSSPSYRASQRHRPRRRGTTSSRRPRNNAPAYTYSHFTGNTEVVCENFNPQDGRPIAKGEDKKAHSCPHVYADGAICGARFQRSEHLKRHAGKHSEHRPYPCPLPKCVKAIQRPDNAADHFKTHIKPMKKGKRNLHFEWSFVRKAIETAYPDKKRAGKLLENLQKWVDAGMPESASQRQGNPGGAACDGEDSVVCHSGRMPYGF